MQTAVVKYPESYSSSKRNGRSKKIAYSDDITLDSSWEYYFVLWCDKHNILWVRNTMTYFNYTHNNIDRKYFPDFYIPRFDCYVEVKGYIRDKDISKWSSVKNLIVIDKSSINNILNSLFSINDLYIMILQRYIDEKLYMSIIKTIMYDQKLSMLWVRNTIYVTVRNQLMNLTSEVRSM